ncbi:SpvB/TcaC N-terminal domain-containing protein [Aestuariivivens sediminis]|uniref:SpvB/TcaC N-terminal domain-containing protein n=1 Tax=Aestuariivivens sediminis TaxID=2913557 RepID=UPI001F59AB85|nr:SpvB/TcaC N-terminal domain-containing protein [Aestuariivivens sediminis]
MKKKYYIFMFFGILFNLGVLKVFSLAHTFYPVEPIAPLEWFYPSSEREGYIGVFKNLPLDDPSDNVFTVFIKDLPKENVAVWLTYELYGIADYTGISHSINDQLATGGRFVSTSNYWQPQKERIKKEWLKSGENLIRFTLPQQSGYSYKIRKLGIKIRAMDTENRTIVINQPVDRICSKDQAYLQGFLTGRNSEKAKLYIEGETVPLMSSGFETVLKTPDSEQVWSTIVKAIFPDGETLEKQVTFENSNRYNLANNIGLRTFKTRTNRYIPGKTFNLELAGTEVSLGPKAFSHSKDLSILALRDVDYPSLNANIRNVTKTHNGYRFLPYGATLKEKAVISMGYDKLKIPDGYTENDIRTFYFDNELKKWIALKKVGLDQERQRIISETHQFTDMINGVLIVPNAPETLGYIPTTMQNMNVANPSIEVNTIEPPQANAMGTATLSYPIEIPEGRQGIQPEINLQYSSDGGNNWLGLGWDLQMGSVTIETRWGVPRYLNDKESETYLLNGEQLWPVAHRNEFVARTPEKRFYKRVEGDFSKIIRHGDNPTNYWWEVTSKSGIRFSYGGASKLAGIDPNAVLRDADNNIAKWALVEMRDLNGNFCKYEYSKVQDPGVSRGTVQGYNIYLNKITYTGFETSAGNYEVDFIRDRQLGEDLRKDVSIDALLGFKMVTADLLRRIEIYFKGEKIRSYELNYVEGAFFKTLLNRITQLDASDNVFNHHEFTYYDDVNSENGYDPYLPDSNWEGPDDDVPGNRFLDKSSMLGGSRSVGGGFGMAVTVGPFDGLLFTKDNTAGANVGANLSRFNGLIAFVDINGDGLDDKVFKSKSNAGLFFRPNLSDKQGNIVFGEPIEISGVSDFEVGWNNSVNRGIESNFIVRAAKDNAISTNVTNTYFADVNGDKLMDIVKRGTVYFNHLVNGVPTFSTTSAGTPSPIFANNAIDGDIVEPETDEEKQKKIDDNPLHDVIRVWEAPYTGIVNVYAPVSLLKPEDPAVVGTEDGVRVAIQHNGAELWSKIISPEDLNQHLPASVAAISITAGDRIYFRVQSIENGTNDQVIWKPIITYLNFGSQRMDANNLPVFQFNSYKDFLISAPMSIGMPIDGTITIEGSLTKPQTSDNMILEIVKEGKGTAEVSTLTITKAPILARKCKIILNGLEHVLPTTRGTENDAATELNKEINKITGYRSTVSDNVITITSDYYRSEIDMEFDPYRAPSMKAEAKTTVQGENGDRKVFKHLDLEWNDVEMNTDITLENVNVEKDDDLFFRLISDTDLPWPELEWHPRVFYTASSDPDFAEVTDDEGNPLLEYFPVVDQSIYNRSISPTGSWKTVQKDTINVLPKLPFDIIIHSDDITVDDNENEIIFTIKKANELVYKEEKEVVFVPIPFNGLDAYRVELPDDFSSKELIVDDNEEYFFDFYLKNTKVALSMVPSEVELTIKDKVIPITAGIHTIRADEPIFGCMYRGWGQFAYNGNRDRGKKTINEKDLKFDDSYYNDNSDIDGTESPDDILDSFENSGGNDPSKTLFIYMTPDVRKHAYLGYDDLTYVKRDSISSSRLGMDDINQISPIIEDGPDGGTGTKAIRLVNVTYNRSYQGGFRQIVVNLSLGTTNQSYNYMDMNADGYPDIVSLLKIQYTEPTGGFQKKAFSLGSDLNGSDITIHGSLGVNGGGELINSNRFTKAKRGNKSSKTGKNAAAQGTVGLNGSINGDSVAFSFMDINSDGLPDKVRADGSVALNLGYKFSDYENWNFLGINQGQTISVGAGLAVNISYGSIEAGLGITRSWNIPRLNLQDINGDGLLDWILDDEIELPFDLDKVKEWDPEKYNDFKAPLDSIIPKKDIEVRINTGNGFSERIPWKNAKKIGKEKTLGSSINAAFTACIPIVVPPGVPVAKVCFNPDADVSRGFSKSTYKISDFDGDGFPDLLASNSQNHMQVNKSTIGRTNLLKKVIRPLGATLVLSYKKEGNTYDLPESRWTLSQVEIFDGFKGDGVDTLVNTYEYENGKYNRNEREFYGFGSVITHNLDTQHNRSIYRSIIENYHTDNYYSKGLLATMIVEDAEGRKFTETESIYVLRDIHSGEIASNTNTDDGAFFPALEKTQIQYYEGQSEPEKSSSQEYKYDAVGNLIKYTDFGDEGSDDDYTTFISYHHIPSAYIIDIPSDIVVKSNGKTYRKRTSEIDQNTGKITKLSNYLENGDKAVSDMTYDEFGNLTEIKHPENIDGDRFFYKYQYDPEVSTYITSVTDAYGYTSNTDYDYRFGKMLLNTDFNNQPVKYELDDVGRAISITGPLELAQGKPYTMAVEYNINSDVPYARTKHYDPRHPNNDMEIITFIDGLKRMIQIKKDASVFTDRSAQDEEKMIVSGITEYDAFSRKMKNYYPTTETKGSATQMSIIRDNVNPTIFTYDVLDRIIQTTDPDGTLSLRNYGFGTDRDGKIEFSTKIIDGNGIVKESFKNLRQLTTSVREQYSQGNDVWTSYKYSPVNSLVDITDDQKNHIIINYDWFGRRTEITHPDSGTTSYVFDLSNNLIKKTTANLKKIESAITYGYEFERLTHISYPENPQNNVSYTYGKAEAEGNGAGRVVLQEDATGVQEFYYNPLGALNRSIRTIVIPDKKPLTYETRWDYDTWGRLLEMTYPDKEQVTYSYNLGGNLASMVGDKEGRKSDYLKRLGYNKFEQLVYLGYGNGTEMDYSYFTNDFGLLQSLEAHDPNNRTLMDNHYTYDDADNILRIQNKATNKRSNLMGGESDYNLKYDDLYRLTSASGIQQKASRENQFELEMSYNSLNNITSKNQIQKFKNQKQKDWVTRKKMTFNYKYDYDEDQPHAPIHIGDQTFTYDLNGNLTGVIRDQSGRERKLVWDEENRIMAIADNGAIFSYVYDADDHRVLKSNGGGQMVAINGDVKAGRGSIGNYTVYVNPYVVVRNSMVTKHYYMNGQRIATKLVESNEGLLQKRAGEGKSSPINYQVKQGQLKGGLAKTYAALGIPLEDWESEERLSDSNQESSDTRGQNTTQTTQPGIPNKKGVFIYYYHPDHLGNSTYISDGNGNVTQYVKYLPFGETFIEEHGNTERTPYLYNGKELDEETGLYYYGARYYNPNTSAWLSIDPLLGNEYLQNKPHKGVFNPINLAGYSFAGQNPIKYTDQEGNEIVKNSVYEGSGIVRIMADYFERQSGNEKPYSFDKKKNRYFWSGGPLAMESALKSAKKNNAITLEMTLEGQNLEKLTEILGFEVTENLWKQLSSGYASGATGNVKVFRRLILREGNIWENQEMNIIFRINKKYRRQGKIPTKIVGK